MPSRDDNPARTPSQGPSKGGASPITALLTSFLENQHEAACRGGVLPEALGEQTKEQEGRKRMPDRIQVNGRWYIAEDAIPSTAQRENEPWEKVTALCKEFKVDPHAAYAAAKTEELGAKMPRNAKRGLKCKRSEFVRWNDARMGAWCD